MARMKLCAYLLTCAAPANLAETAAGGALPARLLVCPWGETTVIDGSKVVVNAYTVQSMPLIQRRKGWETICLDFEHNTVPGTPEFKRTREPRHIAAKGRAYAVAGEGIYFEPAEWTPSGVTHLADYPDLSPALLKTPEGVVIGVHSVALCRHGALPGVELKPFSVDEQNEEDGMDWRKWMCELLGMDENTSDEALKDAFTAKLSALSAEAVNPIKALVESIKAEANSMITALSADLVALKGEVSGYAADILRRDRDDVLNQAAREGKLVALSTEAVQVLTLAQLREHVAALPVTVPVEQRTVAKVTALSAEALQGNAALVAVARACGVDPANIKD
jgi:hypothetical protein